MAPEAIIFDKDGTLFDFEATWSVAMRRLLKLLAPGDEGRAAEAIGFDFGLGRFASDSVAIAGTAEDTGRVLAPVVGLSVAEVVVEFDRIATETVMVPVVDLVPCFSALRRMCPLAIVTNDSQAPARRHIRDAGLEELFGFLAGFDSGYGVKPAPDPLLAAARALGARPERTLMVGDSLHDLDAGRAAGMFTVGVLTGVAKENDLAPSADVVLPDIGHLERWIGENW